MPENSLSPEANSVGNKIYV